MARIPVPINVAVTSLFYAVHGIFAYKTTSYGKKNKKKKNNYINNNNDDDDNKNKSYGEINRTRARNPTMIDDRPQVACVGIADGRIEYRGPLT